MKKRLKKKMYKEILKAKDDLNTCTGHFYDALYDGYINPETRSTRYGRAIRKVVNATSLDRQWHGWSIALPSTKKAMSASEHYTIAIDGKLYAGCTDFSQCVDATVTFNLKRLLTDSSYRETLVDLTEFEMIQDILECLNEVGDNRRAA